MERTMPISGTNSCSDNAPPKMTRTSFPGHTVTKGYYRMFVDNRTMKNIVGGMRTVFIHRKRKWVRIYDPFTSSGSAQLSKGMFDTMTVELLTPKQQAYAQKKDRRLRGFIPEASSLDL